MMADPVGRLVAAPLPVRRTNALILLAGLLSLAGGTAWLGAASLGRMHLELRDKREMAGRLQAIAAMKPALVAQGQAEKPRDAGDTLEGDSEALVRGTLQTRVGEIAAAHGAALLSVGNLPDSDVEGVRTIGIGADLSGTVEAIHNTLLAIEGERALVIHGASFWLSGVEQGPEATQPPELSAQIKIQGAIRLAATRTEVLAKK